MMTNLNVVNFKITIMVVHVSRLENTYWHHGSSFSTTSVMAILAVSVAVAVAIPDMEST